MIMGVSAELFSLLMLGFATINIVQGVFMRPPYNDEKELKFFDELIDIARKSPREDAGRYVGNDNGIEEIGDEQLQGVQKWTGHYVADGKEYPMTLKVDLDMQKGLIAGEGTTGDGYFSVAGTVKSSGKVTFYAVSEKQPPYTFKGMYTDGKIKGKYSVPGVGGEVQVKLKGRSWEGTYDKGPGKPNSQYKMEDVHLVVDENGKIKGTGKDYFGKIIFTGTTDSNGNSELSFHYAHNPTNPWTWKGKFNRKEKSFKGTFIEKKFHGSFELTKV